jgi:hypothetical protein
MCLLHDQEEYGICRWSLRDIAQAVGTTDAKLRALVAKKVLKGADAGAQCEQLIYVPRSGRKNGTPVSLIEDLDGPIWFSSRMVEDEYKRVLRGEAGTPKNDSNQSSLVSPKGGFGAASKASPEHSPMATPERTPFSCARASRAGASSSSSSSSSKEELNPTTPDGVVVPSGAGDAGGAAPKPECPHQQIIALYHEILPQAPQVRSWTPKRATQLRARWNEDRSRQDLGWWRGFFEYVGSCDFLVGRSGRQPFFADLEWMTKSENFTKIREGKYER